MKLDNYIEPSELNAGSCVLHTYYAITLWIPRESVWCKVGGSSCLIWCAADRKGNRRIGEWGHDSKDLATVDLIGLHAIHVELGVGFHNLGNQLVSHTLTLEHNSYSRSPSGL